MTAPAFSFKQRVRAGDEFAKQWESEHDGEYAPLDKVREAQDSAAAEHNARHGIVPVAEYNAHAAAPRPVRSLIPR